MDDRTLLELAARAAGVFITQEQFERECTSPWDPEWEPYWVEDGNYMHGWRTWYGSSGEIGGWEAFDWDPMTDDGDAFRLAVYLGLTITPNYHVEKQGAGIVVFTELVDSPDYCAATRRAIVRAAAAMGEAKEDK